MKKAIRILVPIIMVVAILLCLGWYLFIYDSAFTRDMLLNGARHFENHGNHKAAAWFYNLAYRQATDNEAVAIELAEHHRKSGNYTQAEFTLSNAIAAGGDEDLYVALCKTYVEQDKLLDAIQLLDNVTNPEIKSKLDAIRPQVPTVSSKPGFYSQYISVSVKSSGDDTLYVTSNGEYPSVNQNAYTQPVVLHDGENTIYAISVAENGLVSPLGIFGYTVGGVIEQVQFADPVMESAIRTALEVDESKVLYTNDLWDILTFTVPADAQSYEDLSKLAFLQELTITAGQPGQLSYISNLANLTSLTIQDTAVLTDELPIIGSLPMLQKLTLSGCGISTTDGLEKAQNLTNLDLSNNTIREIDALGSLQNLTEVNLQSNVILDLAPLASMTKMTTLDVSYNTLTSIEAVSNLSNLTYLNAGNNSISSLPSFDKLTNLTHLSLATNSLEDASALASCTSLVDLNIAHNALTDIQALSALTNLTGIDFSENQVSALPQWPSDCQLVQINGSNNALSSISPLSGLAHLNNVYVDYNPELSSLDALADCPVLIQVNAYGTKVTSATKLIGQNVVVNYDPT